ncbi:MAG TPA: hypothetical protein PLD79_09095, partial [Halothiobacillus sp.]|nr:hypothetical protein [Halothiobacillus sp.]
MVDSFKKPPATPSVDAATQAASIWGAATRAAQGNPRSDRSAQVTTQRPDPGRPAHRPAAKVDPDRPARVNYRALPQLSPEALAAQLLLAVTTQGISLDSALSRVLSQAQPVHRGLVQAMGYEVLRHYEALVFWRESLLERPIPAKSAIISLLLLVGLERIRGARREAS